ncbi:hypothetical protein PTNB29_01983 [Pyrenophora teres f. teres]|nr:hypothetical protein PTNB29_01983 [Pyrenophora teres f. teres]
MKLHSTFLVCTLSLASFMQALPQSSSKRIAPIQHTTTLPKPTPAPLPTPIEKLLHIISAVLHFPPFPTAHPSVAFVTVTPGGGVVTSIKTITSVTYPPPPTSTTVVYMTAKTRRDEAPVVTTSSTPTTTDTVTDTAMATAAPLNRRKNVMPKLKSLPSPGDLYVCSDAFWGGDCRYIHSTTYKCHNMPPGLVTKISSIQPDTNQYCNLYADWNCRETDKPVIYRQTSENISDLAFYGLDKAVLSWKCWDDDCTGVQTEGGCHENANGTPKNIYL